MALGAAGGEYASGVNAMINDQRAMGVYVSTSQYPDDGMYSATLFRIEHVEGDATVESIEIPRERARQLVALLTDALSQPVRRAS